MRYKKHISSKCRIVNAKYNKRYREIRTVRLPRYIVEAKNKKEDYIKVMARARYGNEECKNKY